MRLMVRLTVLLCAMLLLPMLAGCQMQQEFWVNPDGSGKVTVTSRLGAEADQFTARQQVAGMVLGSDGIESWKDLAVTEEDGKYVAKCTGYFKDVTKVRIGSGGAMSGPGAGGLEWKREGEQLMVRLPEERGPMSRPTSRPALDDKAVGMMVKQIRPSMTQMPAGIENLRVTYIVHAPAVVKASGFKQDGNVLKLEINGANAVAAAKAISADEAGLTAIVKAEGDMMSVNEVLRKQVREKAIGATGPVEAALGTKGSPLFDYAAETKDAKPGTAEMLLATGIIPSEPPAVAKDGGFDSLTVEKVNRPFGPEVWVNLKGKLAFKAVMVEKTQWYYVKDNTGKYLLPAKGRNAESGGGSPTDEGRGVSMFTTIMPGPDTKQLTRMVGVCKVGVASGEREVDLGEVELKAGATGKMGLTVVLFDQRDAGGPAGAGPGPVDGPKMTMVSVKMDDTAKNVKEVKFLNKRDHVVFSLSHQPGKVWGMSSWSGAMPPVTEKFKAVAVVLDDYRTVDVPVDVKDVDVPAAGTQPGK